jgi:hypothetical protein
MAKLTRRAALAALGTGAGLLGPGWRFDGPLSTQATVIATLRSP